MSPILQSLKCCLNPKVLIGLAAVGLGVVVLAPNLIAGTFPVLLALICPLSMLAMMGGMSRMGSKAEPPQAHAEPALANVGGSAAARLALLRAQQQLLQEQSAAVAAEIAAVEPAAPPPTRGLRQAERVAELADSTAARERT